MKTFAGLRLNGKKPSNAKIMITQNVPMAGESKIKLIIAYIVNPIIDNPVAKPSKPSVKLTALENQLARRQ